MAHKLLEYPEPEPRKRNRFHFTMPSFEGKYGVSIFIGGKEIFHGVGISTVILEQVVRRRFLKVPKDSKVRVFNFD